MASNNVLIKDIFPMPSVKNRENIMSTIQTIVSEFDVVKMTIDARKDSVVLWRVGTEDESKERNKSYDEAVRSADMEELEYDVAKDASPPYLLLEAFDIIEDSGLVPSHIVCGVSKSNLRKWFPISRKSTNLYGIPLVFLSRGLNEDDVLYLCGSEQLEAEPYEIVKAVKVPLS